MARNITLYGTTPIKIDPAMWPRDPDGNLKKISLCTCGLSKTFPLCDGAHKTTSMTEEPGKVYMYTPTGRIELGTVQETALNPPPPTASS